MTFNELDNLFQTAKAKGRLGDMTFEQFSALGARATGDETMAEAAQAGPLSNKVRQFNSMLNRGVNASGADEFLGNQFGNLAEFVGVNRETGESVGQAIPRMALDVAPLAAGALALTAGAPVALAGTIGAGGLALSSALSGLGAYGDTGSLGQAAVAAATPAIAGRLAQFGGQAAMNYAAKGTSPFLAKLGVKGGTPIAKEVTQTLQGADVLPGTIMAGRVLSSMPDKIFNYLGQQAAVEGGLLGLDVLTQGTDAVFNKDYLFSNVVGNLAFAGMDIGDFRGTKMLPGETYTAPQVKPATDFMTGPEKLADTFRQTLGDAATAADRALAERAAGLDIARQVYTENLISNQQKLLQESKELAVGKLTTAWEAQKQVDLSTPDLAPTLVALDKKADERTDIEKFLVERVAVTPALERLVTEHNGELKKIQANYTRSLNKFQLEPKEETLFGVPHEALKLTPEFLAKPLADRTQEDYDKALGGKLSDEGIKIVQGIHRSQAGLPHVIGENAPYDNYLRAMVDKSVKLNDPLGVVAAVAAARGEVPRMSDKKVKAKVEKGKNQGKKASEVTAEVEKKATAVVVKPKKATKAEIKKAEAQVVADKMRDVLNAVPEPVVVKAEGQPTGVDLAVAKRLNGLLSQAEPGKMEDTMFVRFVRGLLVGQGETIDGLKKALNERFGLPIKVNLDELTDGMILTARAKMRQAPAVKTPEVGVYGEAELAKDAKVILANLKKVYGDDAEAGALVDLQAIWDNPAFETFKAKKNAFDVRVEQLQNRIAKKARKSAKAADLPITAKGKEVDELDEDDKVDLAGDVEDGTDDAIDSFKTPEEEAAAIKEVQMRALLRSGTKIDAEDHDTWWAGLTPAMQKSRTKMAELMYANLQKAKMAASEGAEMPQVGFQTLKTVDEWADSTLEKSGIDAAQVPLYKQAWKALVDMFQSPEVRVGELTGKEKGAKFARAAGGGFNFGMADVVDGKILRPTGKFLSPAKDGTLSELEFRVNGGLFGPLQKDEVEFYKLLVPEAFSGERVHVQKLWDGLGEMEESVKVVTYGRDGQTSDNPQKLRFDELSHTFYDTLTNEEKLAVNSEVSNTPGTELSEIAQLWRQRYNELKVKRGAVVDEYINLKRKDRQNELSSPDKSLRPTAYYNQISPFDTKKFPVVRVDVVLPDTRGQARGEAKEGSLWARAAAATGTRRPQVVDNKVLWQQDNLHENLPNTVGWAMVQIVPHPVTGEKVMFVGEMQSQWGQKRQAYDAETKRMLSRIKEVESGYWTSTTDEGNGYTLMANSAKEAETKLLLAREKGSYVPSNHPLLPIHQNLILKSVIKEAQKQGISKVAVSDGETAMMTEKHDTNARPNYEADPDAPITAVGETYEYNWKIRAPAGYTRVTDTYNDKIYKKPDGSFVELNVAEPRYAPKTADDFSSPGTGLATVRVYEMPVKRTVKIKEEGGMRLAYDTTAPSIMKKLVGEGMVEDFGVHKNALGEKGHRQFDVVDQFGVVSATTDTLEHAQMNADAFNSDPNAAGTEGRVWSVRTGEPPVKGSPVFRKPDGTPKSSITARVYDITSPSERTNYLFAKQNLGTVYAAALEKQRQIFFNPEAVAKLPPAERLAVNASLLAHEHGHIFIYKAKQGEFGPEAKKLIEDYETWVKTTDPRNVTDLVDVMAELHLGKKMKALPGVADVITNLRNNRGQMSTDEVLANLMGIYAAGMNKVKEPSRFMTLMPKVVRDAFDWVGQQLQSVSQAVKLYTKLGFDSEQIKRAQGVADVFDAARRGARKAENNMEQLAVMANLTPGDVVDLGGKFAEGERYGVSGKPKSMVQSFLNNWIFKPAEVFRPHEFLHKPFVAMTDVSAAIGDETAVALAPMVGHLGVKNRLYVDKDTAWFRIRKSEQLSKLTNVINIDMQKAEKEGTGAALEDDGQGGWKWNTAKLSPENRARWAQASKEQQELIAGFFAKRQMAMKHTQGVILNSEKGKYVSDLGKIISGQTAMAGRFGEGESMAQAIMDALGSRDQVALSRALMATPDETVRPQLLEMAKAYQESLNIRKQFYDTRPNFSSLRRFGAAVVKYAKGGKEETINYRSAAEAEAGETARVQDGWTVKSVKLNTQGKQEYKSGLDPELKKMLYDKEKRLKDIIATMPIDDGLRAELMSDLNFSEKLEIQEAAKDITSVRAERKFAAGMESLDVFEQDMLYITKAIRAAKLSELKAKVNSALRHPEAEMNPDVVATFKQVFENLLTPSSPWLQKMSKANAAWFLGMNIPGHFAELMQPVMTHLPELRAMGVSTWEGSKMIRQAQKEIAAVYAKAAKDDLFGKTKGTQYLADYWDKKDPNIADLLRRMVGKIDQGPLSGAYQELGFDQGQLASVINGDKPKTPVELAAAPFNAIANTSLKFYSLFTQHNAISALITGYRAARKLGMNHEEAIARAGLFDTTVNKSGGKANRQASAFKGDGLLGHIFYSLQGYSTGWFGQLAMYYQQGFDKQSYPKLSAAERNNAKAAFRNMLVAQVGMAGLMGLPFMGAGMALLEELTGEDLRSKLYEFVDEATGDPIIANMATHGMSSALADAFGIPVDLHSRFALGGFLGLNSYDGFSASSLFGPTASMINGMWNMGKAVIQEHDVGKALALGGPTGLKNMAKALSEEIDPTTGLEPTMTGSLIKSLGFKSGQERKLQELKKIARNLNEADTRQTKQMAESIASQLGRGPRAVQSMLLENANKLATGEGQEYQQSMRAAVKSLAQKVAQVVESKQFPTDYRELASRRTAGNLGEAAQSLGLNLPPSTEVQRELTKMATYQAMGLSYRPNVRGALERQQQEFR